MNVLDSLDLYVYDNWDPCELAMGPYRTKALGYMCFYVVFQNKCLILWAGNVC